MPGYNGTGPQGEGPMTGGGYGNCQEARKPTGGFYRGRRQTQQEETTAGELEQKSEPIPAPDTVEAKVGTGLGPCGNGIPRGGGRGIGRGYHGGRQ